MASKSYRQVLRSEKVDLSAILDRRIAEMRRMLEGELRRALAEPPGPVADDVEHLAVAALEYHLERRLRSASLL